MSHFKLLRKQQNIIHKNTTQHNHAVRTNKIVTDKMKTIINAVYII